MQMTSPPWSLDSRSAPPLLPPTVRWRGSQRNLESRRCFLDQSTSNKEGEYYVNHSSGDYQITSLLDHSDPHHGLLRRPFGYCFFDPMVPHGTIRVSFQGLIYTKSRMTSVGKVGTFSLQNDPVIVFSMATLVKSWQQHRNVWDDLWNVVEVKGKV